MGLRISCQWTESDIAAIKKLYETGHETDYMRRVKERNLAFPWSRPTDEDIWGWHLACMLTTGQRAGENGPVSKAFPSIGNSEISISSLQKSDNIENSISSFLKKYGFRWAPKRTKAILQNFQKFVCEGSCSILERTCRDLAILRSRQVMPSRDEIMTAELAAISEISYGSEKLHQFGPKQSRHLLKQIGLAIYTLPLDSRLMKFLWNHVEAQNEAKPWTPALADEYSFRMIESWFADLADAVGITPVELDTLLWETGE
jgi:thermostable 8-oxoguanine DNA glycosylase